MYVKDGIAYAGDPAPLLGVCAVRPLEGHKLWVCFSNQSQRIVDIAPILDGVAFRPLKDKVVFDRVYVEYGVPVWNDGEIDISPEWLYENGLETQ